MKPNLCHDFEEKGRLLFFWKRPKSNIATPDKLIYTVKALTSLDKPLCSMGQELQPKSLEIGK
jgi:hypothetical protein